MSPWRLGRCGHAVTLFHHGTFKISQYFSHIMPLPKTLRVAPWLLNPKVHLIASSAERVFPNFRTLLARHRDPPLLDGFCALLTCQKVIGAEAAIGWILCIADVLEGDWRFGDDAVDVAERDWKRVEVVTCCEGRWRHMAVCDRLELEIAPCWTSRGATRGGQLCWRIARVRAKIWETVRTRISRKLTFWREETTVLSTCLDMSGADGADGLCGLLSLAESAVCDASRRMEF
ncbi:hypothetical protein Sjap_021934 [Stephania japonica]|uniref:Uncharacterized protein n=1 Tax=Stephania japonica TaxID=461633 RepID=A0AAP0ET84_9MAGN